MLRIALVAALVALPAIASPFDTPAVSDAELDTMRGGFALPGGLDVALAVRLDTAVDGRLVLRTVFTADQGAPQVAVFAPPPGQAGPAVARSTGGVAAPATARGVEIAFDRSNGVTMIRSSGVAAPAITVGTAVAPAPPPVGWMPLALAAGPVATSDGTVSVVPFGAGVRIDLDGPDLAVAHLTGQAFGTIVANTASDRAIDSVTTIDLSINGATPQTIGSALLRIDSIAIDAVRARGL